MAAVEEVLFRGPRAVRVRIDNAWVVSGILVLIAGHPPDPLWEHLDIWAQIWDHLQLRQHPVRVEKVKGHLDNEAIEQGNRTELERVGNDGADTLAKIGVSQHEPVDSQLQDLARLRTVAMKHMPWC